MRDENQKIHLVPLGDHLSRFYEDYTKKLINHFYFRDFSST